MNQWGLCDALFSNYFEEALFILKFQTWSFGCYFGIFIHLSPYIYYFHPILLYYDAKYTHTANVNGFSVQTPLIAHLAQNSILLNVAIYSMFPVSICIKSIYCMSLFYFTYFKLPRLLFKNLYYIYRLCCRNTNNIYHFYARQRSYSVYMPWQFHLSVCHTGGSAKNG